MKQKLLLLLLGALLSLLPLRAEIITGSCGESATFTLDTSTGVLTISGSGDMHGDITWSDYEIKSAIIEEGITSVGAYSFAKNNTLEKVTLPSSVAEIGERAFDRCENLKQVVFSDGLEIIGKDAFYECNNLKNVELPATIKEIGYGAFWGAGVKNISIPNSVTVIGDYAFRDCYNLQSIIIPSGVITIGDYVFESCLNLQSIVIPNSVTKIGGYCFIDCDNLRSVMLGCNTAVGMVIAEHFGTLYYNVFNGCKSLEELIIGAEENSVNGRIELNHGSYGNFFYECNPLKLIKFNACSSFYYDREEPKKWIKNVSELLSAAGNVRDVVITDKVQSIPLGYLSDCDSLQSLTLPYINSCFGALFDYQNNDFIENRENMKPVVQELRNGEQKTYYLPAGLDSIKILEGCEEIPWGCFYNCSMMKKIVLPASLYSVGEKAFFGCGGLEDIYCLSTNPPAAYDNTFDGVRIATCRLHVPAGTADLYRRSPGWERFFEIIEDAETAGITETATAEPAQGCYGTHGGIKVTNAEGERVAVYSLQGQLLHNAIAAEQEETIGITPGIYIVRVGDRTEKVVVK